MGGGPRVLGRTLLVPPGLGGVGRGVGGGEGHESGWGGAKGPRPDPLGFRLFRPGFGGGEAGGWGGMGMSVGGGMVFFKKFFYYF